MALAIKCTPTSPRATTDACMIAVSGGQQDRDPNGTGGALEAYLEATSTGAPTLRSEHFVPSKNGDWLWQGVIFPKDGSWTITMRDAKDDSSLGTQAVTVQTA